MESYNTPALKRELSQYVSGYVDGEGCFCVSFSKRKKLKIGWETKPSLSVSQNADRREVLDIIQKLLNCGFIRRDYSDKTLKYEIRSLDELIEKVIPHFEKFPMISGKQKDFILFAEICKKMKNGEHLTVEGFRKIVRLAYKMNGSGKRKFTESGIISTL